MQQIVTEGHRGYCAKYPENTLVSFQAALAFGVDAFEFDVWLSKDKVPVLMHDASAYRTCGVDRQMTDMTIAEIKALDAGSRFHVKFAGEKVPMLEEVLALTAAARPDFLLGVEIKEYTEECADVTVRLLNEHGITGRCFFYCFNARIIRYLKEQHGVRTMGYPDFQMRDFFDGAYQYYDDIGISMSILKSEVFPVFADKGLPMHMYCADNETDVRLSIEKGAAFITANDPTALHKVLGRSIGKA